MIRLFGLAMCLFCFCFGSMNAAEEGGEVNSKDNDNVVIVKDDKGIDGGGGNGTEKESYQIVVHEEQLPDERGENWHVRSIPLDQSKLFQHSKILLKEDKLIVNLKLVDIKHLIFEDGQQLDLNDIILGMILNIIKGVLALPQDPVYFIFHFRDGQLFIDLKQEAKLRSLWLKSGEFLEVIREEAPADNEEDNEESEDDEEDNNGREEEGSSKEASQEE